MPTYEYVCSSCGHAWEAVQRISEDPLKECPNCKKQTAARQISAGAGFILKGGGWYSDLYSSAKPAASSSSTGESGSSSKSESKPAETKPAETKPSSPPPAKSD